jgi:hypothetical protein
VSKTPAYLLEAQRDTQVSTVMELLVDASLKVG